MCVCWRDTLAAVTGAEIKLTDWKRNTLFSKLFWKCFSLLFFFREHRDVHRDVFEYKRKTFAPVKAQNIKLQALNCRFWNFQWILSNAVSPSYNRCVRIPCIYFNWPFSNFQGSHSALLSSLKWCVLYSKLLYTSPLWNFVWDCWFICRNINEPSPLPLTNMHKNKNRPIKTHLLFLQCDKTQNIKSFLHLLVYFYGLPHLIQLEALRPIERVRWGKTSPYCFSDIPRVCSLVNESRTAKVFLGVSNGHFYSAAQTWSHIAKSCDISL